MRFNKGDQVLLPAVESWGQCQNLEVVIGEQIDSPSI